MKSLCILSCVALVAASPLALCDNTHPAQIPSEVQISSLTSVTGVAKPSIVGAPSLTWLVSTEQSHPVRTPGVPNFGKLNDHVWRSGQPSREGYQLLASQGLKTVVNLRSEFPQDKDLLPPGVNYIYIPIKDEHAPTQEQAEQFIKIVSDTANWPVLVHCQAGQGRAGTMAALVRCSMDKWDVDTVMNETNTFRSARILGIKPPMASCQRQFIADWQSRAAASTSKTQTVAATSNP